MPSNPPTRTVQKPPNFYRVAIFEGSRVASAHRIDLKKDSRRVATLEDVRISSPSALNARSTVLLAITKFIFLPPTARYPHHVITRFICAFLLLAPLQLSAQTPLPRAHAHNDYEHTRPLAEALEQGFGSVEADVYPIDGDLLVAHDLLDTKPGRNLEKLYLAPIKERFDKNKGEIIPGLKTLILLVDIKTKGLETYQILEKQIEKYKPMLTEFDGDQIKSNAVTIILSGERPTEYLAKQTKRWAAIDGRMTDLANKPPRSLIPLVSDSWGPLFKWRTGEMSPTESAKLHDFISQAHEQGRIIRFWGAPDREETWRLQNAAGVDLINTDHLADLAKFMKANPK